MPESLFKQRYRPEFCNFIKKETLVQVFAYEFCKISKNTYSHRTPLVAASVLTTFALMTKWPENNLLCLHQPIPTANT